MNLIAFILVILVAFGGYTYVRKQQEQAKVDTPPAAASAPAVSAHGFATVPPIQGDSGAVLVFAAQGCPLEDAQRADALAADLKRDGVPVQRINDISFNPTSPDKASFDRVNAIMNGELPIVFVNGRAKANPRLGEVIAEYRGSK